MIFERLKNLREDMGIKQKEIAALLNVSQNTYSQYENDVIALTAENAAKLAVFYDTSVDYLLGLTDEKKPYKRKNMKYQPHLYLNRCGFSVQKTVLK